jgi:hypothetical protein
MLAALILVVFLDPSLAEPQKSQASVASGIKGALHRQ